MTTLQLLIVCAATLLAVVLVGIFVLAALERTTAEAERGPSLAGKSLVVHTRKPDDQSIRGVVAAHYTDRLVLRDAQYLSPSGDHQAAGGLVDVLLINVSTWQEIQAAREPRDPTIVSH